MTKEAALHGFFNSFGIPAYAATSVPDDVVFPWITYDVITGGWGDPPVSLTVNLWYYTESESIPNAKARELFDRIGEGKTIHYDGGIIILRRGSPWCQSLTDENNKQVKRRYINVTAEFV